MVYAITDYVTELLKAIERVEDIPSDPEDDDEKFTNETRQANAIEELEEQETYIAWTPKDVWLTFGLLVICKSYPAIVGDNILPYVKTAIKVNAVHFSLSIFYF